MVELIIFLLLCDDDIVLLIKYIEDICKKLKVLQQLWKNYKLTFNIDKTKVMIIKSKKTIYPPILYGDNTLEDVQSYKYLGIVSIVTS